jgi:phage tail-like protein
MNPKGWRLEVMALGDRNDPVPCFNFAVLVNGVVVAGFSDVSGLQAEVEILEYREGGVNEYIHKRAGPIRYSSNLTLKRGVTDATAFWSWYCDVMQGKVERKSVSVVLLDSAGDEKRRWNFQRAYPVKWVGPELRATTSEVAAESLELAHDGLALS